MIFVKQCKISNSYDFFIYSRLNKIHDKALKLAKIVPPSIYFTIFDFIFYDHSVNNSSVVARGQGAAGPPSGGYFLGVAKEEGAQSTFRTLILVPSFLFDLTKQQFLA